uniref:Uncharacterized protein n=1 Tax=Lygus hesperus TaxID=30085 RepID=A0A146KMH1_LYGHE
MICQNNHTSYRQRKEHLDEGEIDGHVKGAENHKEKNKIAASDKGKATASQYHFDPANALHTTSKNDNSDTSIDKIAPTTVMCQEVTPRVVWHDNHVPSQ